jgi:hypothetical protein
MSEHMRERREPDLKEARCARCGETFVAVDSFDLLHVQRRDGELCGGEGAFFRKYVIRDPNRL